MQAFQQLCGFNTLMYYSATLFKEIGFNQPTAVGLIISGTNFIFTLIALKWIDKIGRRRIMIWSAPGMVVGLTLASISFFCKRFGPPFLITVDLSIKHPFRYDEENRRKSGGWDTILKSLVCHRSLVNDLICRIIRDRAR